MKLKLKLKFERKFNFLLIISILIKQIFKKYWNIFIKHNVIENFNFILILNYKTKYSVNNCPKDFNEIIQLIKLTL